MHRGCSGVITDGNRKKKMIDNTHHGNNLKGDSLPLKGKGQPVSVYEFRQKA